MNTTPETTPITLTVADGVSINDLLEKKNEGISVMRSAHVGNASPYNLTLADAGIPMLLVDQTITGALDPAMKGVDRTYFPEAIITQSEQVRIARAGLLVCRAEVQAAPSPQYVDEFHLDSLRSAFANASLYTDSTYVQKVPRLAQAFVNAALKNNPQLFTRVVTPDGTVHTSEAATLLAQKESILPLQDDPRAARLACLTPNEVNIAINFAAEALLTGKSTQYHLSGPDMVRYIFAKNSSGVVPIDVVANLYKTVRESTTFGRDLPAQLDVQLVPTAAARFATTLKRRYELQAMLAALVNTTEQLAELDASKKEFFTNPANRGVTASDRQKTFTAKAKAQQEIILANMNEVSNDIPELFTAPQTPGFITQYDVLQEGGLWVAPQNRQLSMQALQALYTQVQRIRNGKRP